MSTIPSTTQGTIQWCQIPYLHAGEPTPNMITNLILSHTPTMPIAHISKQYMICHHWWDHFTVEDHSVAFNTILTVHNLGTRSAAPKHSETHSGIELASSCYCTLRRTNSCTLRSAKSACREMMANTPTDEGWWCMHKVQSTKRSQLSLSNPESVTKILWYSAVTEKSISGSHLTDRVQKEAVMDYCLVERWCTTGGWLYHNQN